MKWAAGEFMTNPVLRIVSAWIPLAAEFLLTQDSGVRFYDSQSALQALNALEKKTQTF